MCVRSRIKTNGAGRVCSCGYSKDDEKVQSGLSVTPSEMMKLAERGIPVSSQSLSSFYDGESNPSWDMPLEQRRGIDMAALWQEGKDIRQKLKSAHVADIQKYGV